MANSGPEKDMGTLGATEPIGGAESTNNDEPLDIDGKEREYVEIATHDSPSADTTHSGDRIEKEERPGLAQTKSYATTTSAVTRSDSQVDTPVKRKPWYKKINPLKWGAVPPVPETRGVSREYTASFLSLVYFQWMAPLMNVSP